MSAPARRIVSVCISGKEYRYVDETMERIKQRTGAVDSVEVALLTALNAARELDEARGAGEALPPSAELRGLIERIEAAVDAAGPPHA